MKPFFEFFVKRHTFANILTIMIILLGLAILPSINRDTFPDVDLDEVVIVTQYQGASPEDIELKITNKIEEKLKSIDGIKRFSSISIENNSLIDIFIESDVSDPEKVKDDIREKIDLINDFPTDLQNRPTVTEILSSSFPILEIGISAEDLTYEELRAIAKLFKKELEEIKGVSSVEGYGYLSKEMRIKPTPALLDRYQLSLIDIVQTISNQNRRSSMGNFIQNNAQSTIVNDSRLFTVDDVKAAIIRSNFNGKSVRIDDVAIINLDFEDPTLLSRVSGENGISFSIIKSSSADIITVSDKIEALVEKYKEKYPNIIFVSANDFSKYLKNRLSVMINNGIIGLILVNLVLWFFLDLRSAFWVSLGIPVAVMGVFFLMPALGMTINIISLLALIIVIGIIVDDGIIVAENIAKFKEKGMSNIEASIAGVNQVFKPVLTTILTTIIAFSPMFFMSGIMGKFIYQIPLVITCALLISLIEVVIALPSHLSQQKDMVIKLKPRHHLVKLFRDHYERVLTKSLKFKYLVVLGFVVVFFGTMLFSKHFMNFVLFPDSSAVQFLIKTEAPAGTPLNETAKLIQPFEQALMELPKNELLAFTTRVGMTGDAYFLVEQENMGIIIVDLVPFTGRDRSAREIMNDIKRQTKNVPGLTKINFELNAGGPPVGKPINIQIISDNDELRTKIATDVYNYVNQLDGIVSLDRNDKNQKTQMNIALNYDAIANLGLNIAVIQQVIRTGFSGNYASTMRIGDEDINFNVELSAKSKENISVLEQLLIPNNRGRLIRLKDISTINEVQGSPDYHHYDGKRSITISGDIDKKVITSTEVAKLVETNFTPIIKDLNLAFVFGGETEETNESVQGLIRSFLLAIIGIFFLLVLLFNSLTQPLIVLLTIPFGLIGVIIAFASHGQDLGFISMVGTVGLTGVVVNDSLVLVNHLNNIKSKITDKNQLLPALVIGSGDRFRPILITSCTTVAGLLPLAYGLGGSDPFIAPMALAIGYGLLFSTPLTLFLLPALYLIQMDLSMLITKVKTKLTS